MTTIMFQNVDAIGNDLDMKLDGEPKPKRRYVMTFFGRCADGTSCAVEIHGFRPYMFVALDNTSSEDEMVRLVRSMGARFDLKSRSGLSVDTRLREAANKVDVASWGVVRRKRFRGFENNRERNFLRIDFHTRAAMRKAIRRRYEVKSRDDDQRPRSRAPALYESDMDPLVRFIDVSGIEPCNWVVVDGAKPGFRGLHTPGERVKAYSVPYDAMRLPTPAERASVPVFAPLRTLLIDGEMESSHGAFPLAKKRYMRIAHDIVDIVGKLDGPKKVSSCIHGRLLLALDPTNAYKRLYLKCDDRNGSTSAIDGVALLSSPAGKTTVQNITRKFLPKGSNTQDWKKYVRSWKRIELAEYIDQCFSSLLPSKCGVHGDRIIQLGAIVTELGVAKPRKRTIFVLGGCDPVEGTDVRTFEEESALLLAFADFVRAEDPDVISGYNIIPFDLPYYFDRASECGPKVLHAATDIGRLKRDREAESSTWVGPWRHLITLTKMRNQRRSSAAMGDSVWRRLDISGRVQIDQCVVVRDGYNFNSYKLDSVAGEFMYGTVGEVTKGCGGPDGKGRIRVTTNDIRGVSVGDYVTFSRMYGAVRDKMSFPNSKRNMLMGALFASQGSTARGVKDAGAVVNKQIRKKVRIASLGGPGTVSGGATTGWMEFEDKGTWLQRVRQCDQWNQAKDDVPPERIFELQRGSDSDRAELARYCIKDVQLTVDLMSKILILENNVAFANICGVPLSWISDRGQGAKIHAFIAATCRKDGYLMPRLYPYNPLENKTVMESKRIPETQGELHAEAVMGAFVLEPKAGIYDQDTVAVVDYTSLYPSSMIACAMSHEALAYRPSDIPVPDGSNRARLEKDGLFKVFDVEYDGRVYTGVDTTSSNPKSIDPVSVGRRVARFICPVNKGGGLQLGVLPRVLNHLLSERKATKKQMKAAAKAGDMFLASVLDGRQRALKVTANSIYGQTGSRVSKIRCTAIAAATTAEGRNMLLHARDFVSRHYTPGRPLQLPSMGLEVYRAETIYGDTDSLFIEFHVRKSGSQGPRVRGELGLRAAILAGEDVEKVSASEPWLRSPHCLEYEKAYFPFIIVSKKKYVGMKYAAGKTTPALSSMGIVLKRRDNPPILKRIYGDIIDGLMKGRDFGVIVQCLSRQIRELLEREKSRGLCDIDDLVVTKRLRDGYKNPRQIAHKVLADRIAVRDPGNAPRSNDRVPYVFIKNPLARLQGERIETPGYIRKNSPRVRVDYEHYVKNVIMKPVSQVLALRLEAVRGFEPAGWNAKLANEAGRAVQRCGSADINKRSVLGKKLASLRAELATMQARERKEKETEDAAKITMLATITDLQSGARAVAEASTMNKTDAIQSAKDRWRRRRSNYLARRRRLTKSMAAHSATILSLSEKYADMDATARKDILSGSVQKVSIEDARMRTLRENEVHRLIFHKQIRHSKELIQCPSMTPLGRLGFTKK